MKCPRCGAEMTIDGHRKIPLNMCYECGYIEGRSLEGESETVTNYSHLKGLTLTEAAAFPEMTAIGKSRSCFMFIISFDFIRFPYIVP